MEWLMYVCMYVQSEEIVDYASMSFERVNIVRNILKFVKTN